MESNSNSSDSRIELKLHKLKKLNSNRSRSKEKKSSFNSARLVYALLVLLVYYIIIGLIFINLKTLEFILIPIFPPQKYPFPPNCSVSLKLAIREKATSSCLSVQVRRERGEHSAMEEEIKTEFSKGGFAIDDEEEVLKKCLSFCINYKLTPSDLVSSWEVYYLNRQLNEPTVQNVEMDGFLLHLQNEQKEMIVKAEPGLHIYSSQDVDMILNDEEVKEDILVTPDKSHKLLTEPLDSTHKAYGNDFSSMKKSKLVTPYGQRTEKFAEKFNIKNRPDREKKNKEHELENLEDDIIKRVQPRESCSLMIPESGPKPGCRFMYDSIENRFNALEKRIMKHESALVDSKLYEEPMDPTIASQRSVFAVGMICCDGDGHLNDKSILLQSSVERAGGQRVRLDLPKVSQFSIFPGQIVGVEGHNFSGHCFVASKLVDSIPCPVVNADSSSPPTKKLAMDPELQSMESSSTPAEISMIVASGPYTTTDNLLFEPLMDLLSYARRKLPQLLILMGPFIDSEHPEIKKGITDYSFDDIFRLEVLRKLQDHVEYMGTDARVILIPSIQDAHHDVVFPQPAFDIHLPDLRHQITSITNPGMFESNQVKIGCCTVDILKHLSGEELSRIPSDGVPSDRMARLASHLLRQRSFYPLHPPAESVPLDYSLAPKTLEMSSIPDILILPSNMKYFVKVLALDGSETKEQVKCLCVNPGRLAKGEGGGTFAEIYYHGSPDAINASIISI